MRYIRINVPKILFFILLLIPERFIYLVNSTRFYSLTHIKYTDFVYMVYLVLFLYAFWRYRTYDLRQYYFAGNVLTIVFLTIVASVVPHFIFGQSFFSAFLVQRRFLLLICSYYLARTAIINNIISKEYFWKCIYALSFVITGVFIIQHALSNYVRILNVNYSQRFGVRIIDNFTYSTIFFIGSLIMYCRAANKKEKIVACIGLIMAYYHCMFILQTRIIIVAYGISTITMILFFYNKISKKVMYLLIIGGIILWSLESDLGQYFISAILDTSSDPSAKIRVIGKELYIREISKSPLFGRGYPYNTAAYNAAGMYNLIYLNDNGIYGFAYIYGLLGVAWYIWISIKMFVCSINALNKGEYKYLLYSVFMQVICVNVIMWFWDFSYGLMLTIMLAMMEDYHITKTAPGIALYFGK